MSTRLLFWTVLPSIRARSLPATCCIRITHRRWNILSVSIKSYAIQGIRYKFYGVFQRSCQQIPQYSEMKSYGIGDKTEIQSDSCGMVMSISKDCTTFVQSFRLEELVLGTPSWTHQACKIVMQEAVTEE